MAHKICHPFKDVVKTPFCVWTMDNNNNNKDMKNKILESILFCLSIRTHTRTFSSELLD